MTTYETLGDLPERVRDRLMDVLGDGEQFVVAVRTEQLLSRWQPFNIVTDKRFIQYRKKWVVGEELSEVPFDQLSRIDYDETGYARAGKLELAGPGVRKSMSFFGGDGQVLADAIRTQRARVS